MKKIVFLIGCVLIGFTYLSSPLSVVKPTAENPVSVTLLSPTNGSIVSNTITLEAVASSTMGPITKVEFYRDGVLIATVTNPITPPKNLRIQTLLYRINNQKHARKSLLGI